MSIHLQPPEPLVTLVKTETSTVIKYEPPESEIVETGFDDILDSSESKEEIIPDVKDINIVYHPVYDESIKSEILESKHCESIETQVLVKAENSSFIKTENITQRNKSEDTSDGNVNRDTGHRVVEIEASNEHSNALSNLETDEQSVLNFSKNLNGISVRSRKSKSSKKTDLAKCHNTVETTSWEKDKEKINVIKAPLIPAEAHEYISLANDRHVCNHCQYACNRLRNLKKHIEKIHREVTTMYQCPYCPYKSKWSVQKHIIQKHKDTKDIQWFQCHLCEKKFKLKSYLSKHKKVHLKHSMYQCPHCPYKSKWSLCIKKHIIRKHKDTEDIQWFECNLCEMKFKLKSNLTQHMKIHLRHKQMKDGLDVREKRHLCDKCNYKTDRSTDLKKHNLIHLKPEETDYFYCYHCSYKSKEKETLKRHIFTHHFKNVKQGQRHHCDKCEYKTYASTALKRHKLTHLKPEEIEYFYCYHCSYKSKQKQHLKRHIFIHFKKEQVEFDCYICNFMTPKRESIIKHIKKHSKVQNKSEINEGS